MRSNKRLRGSFAIIVDMHWMHSAHCAMFTSISLLKAPAVFDLKSITKLEAEASPSGTTAQTQLCSAQPCYSDELDSSLSCPDSTSPLC